VVFYMPKGLIFVGQNSEAYGFLSRSALYADAVIQTATGIKSTDLPDAAQGVPVPYRLQDLLQAGELKCVVAALDDGAGKRTNRRLYCVAESLGTIKNKSANGGLVGATIAGKTVKSVSVARKASFGLL
jgi:hypothetical protein